MPSVVTTISTSVSSGPSVCRSASVATSGTRSIPSTSKRVRSASSVSPIVNVSPAWIVLESGAPAGAPRLE